MKTTEKKDLKNKIKEFAHTKGADFTGIASCKSLDGAPVGHKPENLLPSVRSVISCAKRIPNSVVNEGPPTSYHNMMRILEVQLDFVSYATSVFIEYFEWLAIPIASNRSNYDWDPETQHGRGDISHKHVAEAAGVGRMGKNSLLITPEFGNRVQLVSIVTNLDLEPDPIINNDLCPPDCVLCIDACPVSAIDNNQYVNQKLCRSFMYTKLPKGQIIESCRLCRKVCPIGIY